MKYNDILKRIKFRLFSKSQKIMKYNVDNQIDATIAAY
jgi:hypothetical protein